MRVLITGMSGVGKSSVIEQLTLLGHRAVDADYAGYSVTDETGDWIWDLDRVRSVLDEDRELIFVSGTASNMGRLYDRFDRIVLLSCPAEVMLQRLTERTNNPYGSTAEQRAESLHYKQTVEPLLRRSATVEIDTTAPLDQVVAAVLQHVSR